MNPHYFYRRQEMGAVERSLPAMVLIGLGALFLLSNLHFVYLSQIYRWWPALFVAFGVVKLVDSEEYSSRVLGGIFCAAGALLLARNLGYLEFAIRNLWPLIPMGFGLWMLLDRTATLPFVHGSSSEVNVNKLREEAVFSGGKRSITSQDFQGGRVTAVFGGYELDFRRANILADSVTLHVDVVFGGCEIRIPPGWSTSAQGTGIFGAFSDESLQPDPAVYHNIKRLVVKGSAVFGGVVIKN
jgi:hypothetical protein